MSSISNTVYNSKVKKHLAILSKEAIQRIFAGEKTIETRFSVNKIPPFGIISCGDTVYMKPPGGEIIGRFEVKKVIFFDGWQVKDWEIIKDHFWGQISLGKKDADEDFIKKHNKAKFATLIFIGKVEQFITSPIRVRKKDLRGWVVLEPL